MSINIVLAVKLNPNYQLNLKKETSTVYSLEYLMSNHPIKCILKLLWLNHWTKQWIFLIVPYKNNNICLKMEREGKSSTFMSNSLSTNGNTAKVPAIKSDSKHFTSLQIFTSYAEPALDEYITQKQQ